MKGSDKGLICH